MKKILLSLALLLSGIATWAQLTDNYWEDSPRFTADELNNNVEKRIAIKGVWKRDNEESYNKFYRGTNSAIKANPIAKDYLEPENIFVWEPTGDGTTFFLKKAYYTHENQAYLLYTGKDHQIDLFGAKTADNVAKFIAEQPTTANLTDGDFYTDRTEENLSTVVRLKINGTVLYLNTGNPGFRDGKGAWSVHHVLDASEYRMVTIKSIKYNLNTDGSNERVVTTERRMYKIGATIEVPEYEGYTHNIKVGANAYIKDDTDTQVLEITYLPLYTAEQLRSTTTSKRIALRCVGGSTYNEFYHGKTGMKAGLPLTPDMIFDFEPAPENGYFRLKRAFEEDQYLQTNNPTTFGSKDASPAKFEICDITEVTTSGTPGGKNRFNKNDGFYTDQDFMTTYFVRFAKDGNEQYINFSNATGWPDGIGIWSVQLAVDVSCYRKYKLNIIKHKADGTDETLTIEGIQRVGDDIELPEYFGFINTGDAITKDNTDTQTETVEYNAFDYSAAEIATGDYFIYYIDENDTKHYLQTKGTNNIITVTEDPMYYAISPGVTTGSDKQYNYAYYMLMNDLRIQNTEQHGTQIQTALKTDSRVWTSQVFLQTDEIPGCYAIRLTNSNVEDTWHGYYFLAKGPNEGTTMGVSPTKSGPQDRYIWHVDEVTGRDRQVIALRHCLQLVRETYYNETTGEWLLRDGVNYYNAALLDVYNEALEFYNAITEETPEEEIEAMLNKLEAKRDATQINQPEFNKFYRIRCSDDSQTTPYISAVQDNDIPQIVEQRFTMVALDDSDPNTIFYYYNENDDVNDNSDEGTHLISLSKGRSIECHDFVAVGNNSNVAFYPAANGALCQYNISFSSATHGNGQRWIYGAQTYNLIDGGNNNPPATGYNGYNWQLEEVTTLPIVITEAGYATLYSPVALTLPENSGLQVYYANATTATDMKLTEITGNVIPAETGVILKGEAGTYMLAIGGEGEEGSIEGTNLLQGTIIPEYIDGEIYVLANTANGAGMAKAVQAEEGTHAGKSINNGFKAYLPASSTITSETRFFSFNFGGGDETGIGNVEGENGQNAVIYDLSGRRVQNAVKGLYIVDGKKVVK